MNGRDVISRDDWQRIERLVSDQCSNEDVQALEELLRGNPAAQKLMLEYCQLHLDLSMEVRSEAASNALLEHVVQSQQPVIPAPPTISDNPGSFGGAPTTLTSYGLAESDGSLAHLGGHWFGLHFPTLLLTIGGLLVMVGCVAGWVLRGRTSVEAIGAVALEPRTTSVAYLTSANGVSWGGSGVVLQATGGGVRLGDEIVLYEGIAEFRLVSGVLLSIEGPVSMVLNSESSIVLLYGKLTAHVPASTANFRVAIGACELNATHAEFGISHQGGQVDIHVFSGEIQAASPLILSGPGRDNIHPGELNVAPGGTIVTDDTGAFVNATLTEGFAISLVSQKDFYTMGKSGGRADPQQFATRLPMAGSLPVSRSYIREVLNSRPIGYWRFSSDGETVANEIDGGDLLQVVGKLCLSGSAANPVVAFHPNSESYLVSPGTFNSLAGDDYSVELWVKPSHLHYGGIVALVDAGPEGIPDPHGFSLELIGHRAKGYLKPGSFRFLHRSPPGIRFQEGTSCWSKAPYQVRRWQHVTAVKKADKMRLYIDGVLSATATDRSALPAGLTLVVGRPEKSRHIVPFVGQLDELAIYDRALSEEEIGRHYMQVKWSQDEASVFHRTGAATF